MSEQNVEVDKVHVGGQQPLTTLTKGCENEMDCEEKQPLTKSSEVEKNCQEKQSLTFF